MAQNPRCDKNTAKISLLFPVNSSKIDSDFADNRKAVNTLDSIFALLSSDTTYSIYAISVYGTASPDGPIDFNRKLAMARCSSMLRLLRSYTPNRDFDNIKRDSFVYDWNDAPSRSILPRLRSAYAEIDICRNLQNIHKEDKDTVEVIQGNSNRIDDTSLSQVFAEIDTVIIESSPIAIAPVRDYDRFAIKTNAAYLAAGVTNIGAEMAVSPNWSIDLPIVYSPYTLARKYRMRFLYAQPEARYWLDRPFTGHFFGLHANVGVANVSFNDSRYQTPNGFYGGGISYGFSLPIARRWSMEFTLGLGYFHTEYDSYYNIGIPVGARYEKGKPLNYWGIDKLGINFVYRFGDKSGKRKEAVK